MIIAGVDFPEALLDALQSNRLVVFAGAGASMGSPASLPDFRQLAEQTAQGTGQYPTDEEPAERFLGRLEDRGIDVRERVVQTMKSKCPTPTALHHSLLGLFRNPEDVRLVTTNFDPLFETAAGETFTQSPAVFHAPALPLGNRFHGIVHVHGSVDAPAEMVLTDRDFGRAYLTEANGWATRFLLDLFSNYTVLFVGYSHNEAIMRHLTRAIPPFIDQPTRLALVGDQGGDPEYWRRMGIEPIVFPQANATDFGGLKAAIAGLSEVARRSVLDWQQTMTVIAGAAPPVESEGAAIVEYALRRPELTRFFVENAVSSRWIGWLDQRGHLDKLFADGDFEEQDGMLSYWLATRFAVTRSDELLSTVARHGGRLNSHFWNRLTWCLRDTDDTPLEKAVLARWVHFLMNSLPLRIEYRTLPRLAEMCAKLGAYQNLLQVFDVMSATRYQVWPAAVDQDTPDVHARLVDLWERCLEPTLPHIARSLLDRTTWKLEENCAVISAYGQSIEFWDKSRLGVLPVDRRPTEELPHHIDAFTTIARGCLEWLATEDPRAAAAWCERFAGSSMPLLCRLAVGAMLARVDLSEDDKLAWLLERSDVDVFDTDCELFHAVVAMYPFAMAPRRRGLIEALLGHRASEGAVPNQDPAIVTANRQYLLLYSLYQADPDCDIVRTALENIRAQYPEIVDRTHSDLTYSPSTFPGTYPWTVDELLTKPATEWPRRLTELEPTGFGHGEDSRRREQPQAVGEAVQQDSAWGLGLADALVNGDEWDSGLWPQVLTAWARTEFTAEKTFAILQRLTIPALHTRHANLVADILCRLVQRRQEPFPEKSLLAANSIASSLQGHVHSGEFLDSTASADGITDDEDWLHEVSNHLAGKLALFWVCSISHWRSQHQPTPRSLSADYLDALEAIIKDDRVTGKIGRTVLAGQLHLLLAADEAWVADNLLPLFDVEHADFQCAWDGFLTWGQFSPSTAARLRRNLVNAVPRIDQDFSRETALRFWKFYVEALGWLMEDGGDEWTAEFFKHANGEAKRMFALQISRSLRDLDENRQREWWERWLRTYWENRLVGVPCPLDDEEIATMLEWAVRLTGVFPEVVKVATRMRTARLDRSLILYYAGEADLADRYPSELTLFLLHLNQCETEPWFWLGVREIVNKLVPRNLPANLNLRLRELLVRREPMEYPYVA